MNSRRPILAWLGCCLLATPTLADEAKVNFKDTIATLFQTKCNTCHNSDKKRGGLALDSYGAAMEGGASGPVVEPGDPENSRLYLVMAHEEEPAMPPSSPKLSDDLLDAVRAWIAAGAPETAGSVVALAAKPKMEFTLDPEAMGKPLGVRAMPEVFPTDPLVVSPRPNAILALAASPWAPLVAVAGHKQVLLYDTNDRQLRGVLPFEEGTIHSLSFSRDGGILLAGGGVGGQSGIAVGWDVKTGERLFDVGREYDVVLSADLSPDRRMVALGGPSKLVRVYDTGNGELIYECKKHTEWVTSVAFSPDGVLLSTGDRNGGLVVWEAFTGREFYDLRGHTAMITGLSWRLDSNVLASASEDGSIRLWNMADGAALKNWGAHGGGALDVQFAKDGRLVTVGRDRVPKLWDQDGKQERAFDAFEDVALQAVLSFDDARVIGGDWAGKVRLWSTADGASLGELLANPPHLADRLLEARRLYEESQARVDAQTRELESLKSQLVAQQETMARLEREAEAARSARAQAEQKLQAQQQQVQRCEQSLQECLKILAESETAWNEAVSASRQHEAALAQRNRVAAASRASYLEAPTPESREAASAASRQATEAASAAQTALDLAIGAQDRVSTSRSQSDMASKAREDAIRQEKEAQSAHQSALAASTRADEGLEAARTTLAAMEQDLATRTATLQGLLETVAPRRDQVQSLEREIQESESRASSDLEPAPAESVP